MVVDKTYFSVDCIAENVSTSGLIVSPTDFCQHPKFKDTWLPIQLKTEALESPFELRALTKTKLWWTVKQFILSFENSTGLIPPANRNFVHSLPVSLLERCIIRQKKKRFFPRIGYCMSFPYQVVTCNKSSILHIIWKRSSCRKMSTGFDSHSYISKIMSLLLTEILFIGPSFPVHTHVRWTYFMLQLTMRACFPSLPMGTSKVMSRLLWLSELGDQFPWHPNWQSISSSALFWTNRSLSFSKWHTKRKADRNFLM